MEKYNPQEIESKWQKVWDAPDYYKTTEDDSRPKYYALEMFPYPSGNLHMGHVRNYSIGDVVARYRMMAGFNVLHPMGFDAFGMPAENAAIAHGVKPSDWTFSNIKNMISQQKSMGLAYDWDREVETCREDYYRWTQWLFELFYKRGLAYKKEAAKSAARFWRMSRLLTENVGVAIRKYTRKNWLNGFSKLPNTPTNF